MTNLQKFFSSSPGVIFLFVLALCLASIAEVQSSVADLIRPLLTDRAQLLSSIGLLIIGLGFASVSMSLVIGRVWDAIFYFFGGGYSQSEYERIRQALLANIPADSETARYIESKEIQAIYGTILHSFAPTSFIEWLGRRWTSFNNAGLQATASVLGALASLALAIQYGLEWPKSGLLIVFILVFPLVTFYIGRARLKELLSAEEFFCRSLVDENLHKAVEAVAQKISSRGGSTDGVPELAEQL